jgi:UPF0042 nucleotide-binding protein
LIEAIDKERNLLEPLRAQAHSIDTSNLPAHALRSWIQDLLKDKPVGLTVIFESFGFKKGYLVKQIWFLMFAVFLTPTMTSY